MNFAEDTKIHWVKRKNGSFRLCVGMETIDFVSGMIRRKQFFEVFRLLRYLLETIGQPPDINQVRETRLIL